MIDQDYLPISGLQHLAFCDRQCALIHVERQWVDNQLTAQGNVLHRKVDSAADETHRGVRIVRSLSLRSDTLKLTGVSDVVEFVSPNIDAGGLPRLLRERRFDQLRQWTIIPVEYKRGRPKTHPDWGNCDEIQLCVQAMCLEEQWQIEIPAGRLFYGETRRRHEVVLDTTLRQTATRMAAKYHRMVNDRFTPPPVNDSRCKRCSLVSVCMPKVVARKTKASDWVKQQVRASLK